LLALRQGIQERSSEGPVRTGLGARACGQPAPDRLGALGGPPDDLVEAEAERPLPPEGRMRALGVTIAER